MHETGGALAFAVRVYLECPVRMRIRDITLMQRYLAQWIDSPAWDAYPSHDDLTRAELAKLREDVKHIVSVGDIRRWLWDAAGAGIDPL